jgi:hypothetical protein
LRGFFFALEGRKLGERFPTLDERDIRVKLHRHGQGFVPENALNFLQRLASERQMRSQGLAEGVKVKAPVLVLERQSSPVEVFLEGFDFGNQAMERSVGTIFEGGKERPQIAHERRSNLNQVEAPILGQ